MDEFLKGLDGLRFALGGLHRTFLKEQLALDRLFRRIVADPAIIGGKLRRAIESEPAERRVKQSFARHGGRALRDLLIDGRSLVEASVAIIRFRDQPINPFPETRIEILPARRLRRRDRLVPLFLRRVQPRQLQIRFA